MALSASALRNDIYRLLDGVVDTDVPLEIERKGHLLRVTCEARPGKLDKLVKRDCVVGDPEAIVHLDWSQEWHGDLP